MFRPRIPFDPTLRLAEMAAIQFAFYFIYLFTVMFMDYLLGLAFTADQLINFALYNISSPLGRIAIAGQFLGGVAAAVLFCLLETRARNALDFISTTYLVHLLIATVTCRFPRSLLWWLGSVASCAVSTIVAESLSSRLEMQDINLDIALPAVLERSRDPDAHL
jgi:uncharacterized RDD family membrane protein YckC